MIEIKEILFIGLLFGMFVCGLIMGLILTHDYRKSLDKEYEKKHTEIYNTIRKETKAEWSNGWDSAYKSYSQRQKAYFLWFREHGYEMEDIEKWFEKYMEGRKSENDSHRA